MSYVHKHHIPFSQWCRCWCTLLMTTYLQSSVLMLPSVLPLNTIEESVTGADCPSYCRAHCNHENWLFCGQTKDPWHCADSPSTSGFPVFSQGSFCTQTLQKIQGIIQGLQKKLMGQEVQRQTLSQQLQDNTHHLQGLHSRLAAVDDKSSLISQVGTNTFSVTHISMYK